MPWNDRPLLHSRRKQDASETFPTITHCPRHYGMTLIKVEPSGHSTRFCTSNQHLQLSATMDVDQPLDTLVQQNQKPRSNGPRRSSGPANERRQSGGVRRERDAVPYAVCHILGRIMRYCPR